MAHLAHYKEAHPLIFVVTHWINLIAMIMLIPSIGSICILQLLERFNIRYTRISQAAAICSSVSCCSSTVWPASSWPSS